MTKKDLVNLIIRGLLIPIAVWGVNRLDKVNENVAQLNTKVGILIDKSERYDKAIGNLEEGQQKLSDRVLILEQKGK